MAIEFVGGTSAAASGSLSLTSLTGGIASAPAENDIVVVGIYSGSSSNLDMSLSGYEEIADVYANSALDTNLGVFRKVMGSSPDTSIEVPSLSSVRAVVYVLRGVDTATPMDATATTSTRTNGGVPNPALIESATNDALILIMSATSAQGTFVAPSGYTNTVKRDGSFGCLMAASKILAVAGEENPDTWTGIEDDESVYSAASVTMAFRPASEASGNIKVWNGSAWVAKPVKVWNGSSWVVKPVKRWNGSSWVTTTY